MLVKKKWMQRQNVVQILNIFSETNFISFSLMFIEAIYFNRCCLDEYSQKHNLLHLLLY